MRNGGSKCGPDLGKLGSGIRKRRRMMMSEKRLMEEKFK